MPDVVRAFRARVPEVKLRLDIMAPVEQATALREERLDVGFSQWMIDTRGLTAEPLLEEPIVALVPEGHPLAKRELLSLEDVARQPFIAMCSVCTPNVAEEQAALFRSRGLMRSVVQETCSEVHQLGLVAAGLGVGLSLASSANLRRRGVVFVPLEQGTPTSTFFLLWRRGDGRELVSEFLETARQVARGFRPASG
jgi:LysR family transcriptional regulator, benzoate and cis,cis-muconate-responsive activator of ben and cat genes